MSKKKIYFIGIGGISMSGIAEILHNYGYEVLGSDAVENDMVLRLRKNGIKINIGQKEDNITSDIDTVVFTAAIKEDNPELVRAKKLGIETIERGKFLGELTTNFKDCIGVAGTHGKTTTSSMVTYCFINSDLDPSVQIGANIAIVDKIDGNYRVGKSDYFIIEACEYTNSYLNFKQRSAIVTNIDNDHLDFFKNIDNIQKSFNEYVSHLPEDGLLVVNKDDERCYELRNHTKANVLSVSKISDDADYVAKNISFDDYGCASYDVYHKGNFITRISLGIKGLHNVLNSLECFALCSWYGIDSEIIKESLKQFTGASRRMEFKGLFNGARVYDDYGHHPTEVRSTANAILKEKHNESYVIFEAHTFSRVYEFKNEFADALKDFDHIIIIDIYPAREKNIWNVSPMDIVNKLKDMGKDAIHISDYDEIKNNLKERVKEGDLIITIGAGNVTKVATKLVED